MSDDPRHRDREQVDGESVAALTSFAPRALGGRESEVTALDMKAATRGFHTRTCPQCGENPAPAEPRAITAVHRNGLSYFFAGFSAMFFVMTTAALRGSVDLRLPLCDDCVAAHRRGLALRRTALTGLVLSPGIFSSLLPLFMREAPWPFMLIGTISVASIAACTAAYRKTRGDVISLVRRVRPGDSVVLLRTSRTFIEVVGREQPAAFPVNVPAAPARPM